MAFVITKEEGIFKDFVFDLTGEELKKAYEEILNELKAQVNIEGFRKGHAPEWIIKSKFKKSILESLIDKFMDKTYASAKELGLDVVDMRINLDKSSFSEKDNTLKMEGYVEVFPLINKENLVDLNGVELDIPKYELTNELIEENIRYILEEKALLEPKDGVIEEEDFVVINYTVTDKQDGESVSEKLSGVLKELKLREDLQAQLLGRKEGEVVRLENVPLASNVQAQGENIPLVDIEASVESIKRKVYPELTDELSQELSLGQSKEEAIENIKKRLENYIKQKTEEAKADALTSYLLSKYENAISISRSEALRIANLVYEEELSRLNSMFDLSSLSKEVLENIEKRAYNKALDEGAKSALTRSILVSYAKAFDIEVSQDDIDKYIDEQVEVYKYTLPENQRDEASIRRLKENIERYFSREDRKSVLIKDILASKAMDKLLEMVKFNVLQKPKEENVENV